MRLRREEFVMYEFHNWCLSRVEREEGGEEVMRVVVSAVKG